jgi:hypothetical protein
MKKNIIVLSLILTVTIPFHAQESSDIIDTGAANFLTIATDARSAGMGGAGVALAGSDNAIFGNASTALLDKERKAGVSYTFVPWMRDYTSGYSLHNLGGYYKINRRNAVLAGFRFFNYPSFKAIQSEETTGKKIHPKEFAVDLGYAYEVFNNFAISATVKFIRSDMGNLAGAKAANAVAADLGISYQGNINLFEGTSWTAGAQVSNMGPKIKYLHTKMSLPAQAKLGGSITMPFSNIHKLMVTADGGYRMMPSDMKAFGASAGAEYTLANTVMIRGGYHYGDEDKGDFSFASAGAGVAYMGAHLDFSWLIAGSDSKARNTFWVSLGYSF